MSAHRKGAPTEVRFERRPIKAAERLRSSDAEWKRHVHVVAYDPDRELAEIDVVVRARAPQERP